MKVEPLFSLSGHIIIPLVQQPIFLLFHLCSSPYFLIVKGHLKWNAQHARHQQPSPSGGDIDDRDSNTTWLFGCCGKCCYPRTLNGRIITMTVKERIICCAVFEVKYLYFSIQYAVSTSRDLIKQLLRVIFESQPVKKELLFKYIRFYHERGRCVRTCTVSPTYMHCVDPSYYLCLEHIICLFVELYNKLPQTSFFFAHVQHESKNFNIRHFDPDAPLRCTKYYTTPVQSNCLRPLIVGGVHMFLLGRWNLDLSSLFGGLALPVL